MKWRKKASLEIRAISTGVSDIAPKPVNEGQIRVPEIFRGDHGEGWHLQWVGDRVGKEREKMRLDEMEIREVGDMKVKFVAELKIVNQNALAQYHKGRDGDNELQPHRQQSE